MKTGRFAQADPIVQAPENGQSLNRYSYVFNNPLSYTDPTGYTACSSTADYRNGTECSSDQSAGDAQRTEANARNNATENGEAQKRDDAQNRNGVSEGSMNNDGRNGSLSTIEHSHSPRVDALKVIGGVAKFVQGILTTVGGVGGVIGGGCWNSITRTRYYTGGLVLISLGVAAVPIGINKTNDGLKQIEEGLTGKKVPESRYEKVKSVGDLINGLLPGPTKVLGGAVDGAIENSLNKTLPPSRIFGVINIADEGVGLVEKQTKFEKKENEN